MVTVDESACLIGVRLALTGENVRADYRDRRALTRRQRDAVASVADEHSYGLGWMRNTTYLAEGIDVDALWAEARPKWAKKMHVVTPNQRAVSLGAGN